MTLKSLAKDILPPALVRVLVRKPIRWEGDYRTWQSAAQVCAGYDQAGLHERIEFAATEVLAGRAAYERDGVCFHQPALRWPVLAACLLPGQQQARREILDFGGSLASLWLQHRAFLSGVRWTVVEQPGLVNRGRRLFPDGHPAFHPSIAEAVAATGQPHLAILSAVLSWIEDPETVLRDIIATKPAWILVDRTGVNNGASDRITVQRTGHPLPTSSYPCRFFAAPRIPALLSAAYRLVSTIDCDDHCPVHGLGFQGWLFERNP